MKLSRRGRGDHWHTHPWRNRLPGGVYVSHSKDAWVYRVLPLSPLEWEDASKRLENQSKLERMLIELGETSRDLAQGVRALTQSREVHLLSVLHQIPVDVPDTTPELLREFQERMLFSTTPAKILFVGVKLRRDALSALTRSDTDQGLFSRGKAALKASAASATDLSSYSRDFDRITALLLRAGAHPATDAQLLQLESWFNSGQGPDVVVQASDVRLHVANNASWQLSALMDVDELDMQLSSPGHPFLLEAANHPYGADVISIRAELEPATVTRGRLRRSQRQLRAQQEEEEATGDITKDELDDKRDTAKQVENYVRAAGEAWLTETSVLFARRITTADDDDPDETYADTLRSMYGMNIKPLEKRQLEALAETLPASGVRVNPFPQDVNPAWVAYSGLPGFGQVGDETGLMLGGADPHWTNTFIDPYAAANQNKPPIMGVFGDPGSGKTFAAQLLCAQAALAGVAAILINPKGYDSLRSLAEWVTARGGSGQVVSMQALESEPGAFDPFRFTEPKMAAEILTRHILTVIGVTYAGGLTGKQETELGRGLSAGALAGARCAAEALDYVRDPDVVEQVMGMVEYSTLFGLAFGRTPAPPWGAAGGLTLVEFDREMPLPTAGKDPGKYERDERIAVGALRLVSRASLEILMRAGGGVLVVDEAHHFLGSAEGMATLDRIGREGRSLGLLPIFCTQRVTDLLKVDMESFMSRVLVMKLQDKVEAAAALKLCRLEPTEARMGFLQQAGPAAGRGALGFFRDIDDRHAVVMTGMGVPEDLRLALSTNRKDRQARAHAANLKSLAAHQDGLDDGQELGEDAG